MIQTQQTQSATPPPLTLEQVKSDFLNWRRDPAKKRFISDDLWSKVIYLIDKARYPKTQVLNSLGIHGVQLKMYLAKQKQQPNRSMQQQISTQQKKQNTQSPFVVAAISPDMPASGFDVILTRPDGTTLQIQKMNRTDMLTLAKQFARQ